MDCKDKGLEFLVELDGTRFVVDDHTGLWIKFEVKKVEKTSERPHGIRYSLTLHDGTNGRILGFDNSHPIEYGGKNKVPAKRIYDHWHSNNSEKIYPYFYESAEKLLEDFWVKVVEVLDITKRIYEV
ncbi:MAG TPA: DUF6516 family protein [Gammaproteobacteria bacterium]|nr:DUF6516 family protein [Gammaproteobacteria bacterium]